MTFPFGICIFLWLVITFFYEDKIFKFIVSIFVKLFKMFFRVQ
jgi:hypothetical protein